MSASAVPEEAGFAYVSLAGEIGVLGNGAGLVMSLLDAIEAAGGRAANFLDVGGGATCERIAKALEILLSDDRVRVLLWRSSAASRAATRWPAVCSRRLRPGTPVCPWS